MFMNVALRGNCSIDDDWCSVIAGMRGVFSPPYEDAACLLRKSVRLEERRLNITLIIF